MPNRSRKLVFLSHCILNQNTIATGLVNKGYKSGVWEIVELCKRYDVGIEQLPCPEFLHLGLPREPMTKDRFEEVEGFTGFCKKLARDVVNFMKKLKAAGFEIKGIIGIAGSPSCGTTQTNVGVKGRKRVKGKGIFMEELSKELIRNNMKLRMEDFDYRDKEGSLKRIELILR